MWRTHTGTWNDLTYNPDTLLNLVCTEFCTRVQPLNALTFNAADCKLHGIT